MLSFHKNPSSTACDPRSDSIAPPRTWTGGILLAMFGLGLWIVNLLPIQQADQVLVVNVAISPERQQTLKSISNASKIDSRLIRWIECQSPKTESHRATGAELRAVRIRAGLACKPTPSSVEKELERLTRPQFDSQELHQAQAKHRQAKWRLASLEHSLRRTRLDLERESNAVPFNDLAESETSNTESDIAAAESTERASPPWSTAGLPPTPRMEATENDSSPFRLASAKAPRSVYSASTLHAQLENQVREAKEIVNNTERELQTSQSQSKGFLSMTGSPRITAAPRPMNGASIARLALALTFAFIAIAVGTLRTAVPVLQYVRSFLPWSHPKNPKPISDVRTLVRELQSIRVAYLGMIHLPGSWTSPTSTNGEAIPEPREGTPTYNAKDNVESAVSTRLNCTTFSRLADCLFLVWIILFLARYTLDPIWRDLLFQAPLAALSTVLFGV